ncbi:MAG: protein kinase domain-containing protein [Pyrinomonadaceae bacterium]
MTPKRYQRIGKLYHSVLELAPDERPPFLAQACDGDEELLREVESLIASHEQAGSFIESPAIEVAAKIVAEDSYSEMVGRHLSHYEIKELLGAGGMGEVYLARDTRLGRQVALKLLPGAFINDAERVRRFEREARAASALNHPNILTIYEIERAEDKHFIAMEYIDGETLRDKIHRERTPLPKLLKCLQQVAEGLSKAHAAGIVHRDLKPDNIMVTRDGYAKVLDFGLAKLIEQPKPAGAGDATSSEAVSAQMPQHSLPGMVRGTVGYMSPEQAQGKVEEIDRRSDIFSFGCILFEAATGRKAFEGRDALDSLYKIVHAPTPQIKETNADAPDELQRIVRRCLAKDPERRYQSIKDVAIELEELQHELEAEPAPQHFLQTASGTGTTLSGDVQAGGRSADQPAVSTSEVVTRPTTSAEYIANEIERHKAGAALIIVVLAVATAGIAYGLYKFVGHKPATSLPSMKMTRLTNSGKVGTGRETKFASISPDGKYVAYAALDESGQTSLWVRHVATTSNVQIVPPAGVDVEVAAPAFSPDSNYVCYIRTEKNGPAILYRVPVLGGTSKKLLEGMRVAPISFSPDGERFTFIRSLKEEDALMLANADGTGEQILATRKYPEQFAQSAAWSPDGKTIACPVRGLAGTYGSGVAVIQVADGTQKPLTSRRWVKVERVAWLSDGSGVIMTAEETLTSPFQIWQISYPEGEPHPVTSDLNDYHNVSLTADSSALVTVLTDITANIWVAPTGEWYKARQLTSEGKMNGGIFGGTTWTPDGRIVYRSFAGGNSDIWIMEADGHNQKQLTDDAYLEHSLTVTGDGRYIVFDSDRSGSVHVWRVDINGSNPKQLTTGVGAFWPRVSPDGKWITYTSLGSGESNIWKVSIDGGQPVPITDKFASQPVVSPDGKLIACYSRDEQTGATNIALLPFAGGSPVKLFNLPQTANLYDSVSWTPDGRALTYINGRGIVTNIWLQPVDGGQPRQLTDFNTDRILSFDWSHDGKWLAVSRGVVNNDVVLISNFR